MTFTLPELPFAIDALEPHMSRETLEYHWGKHHQTYVNNLNNLIKGTEWEGKKLPEIVRGATGGLYNNAAQTLNHTFFWNCLTPNGGGKPSGQLLADIEKTWGTFEAFKEEFAAKAAANFGSGWTWLVRKPSGELEIQNMGAAGNPLVDGNKPVMTIDIWEHAYYVDYRNARPKFIETFLEKLVNWTWIENHYEGKPGICPFNNCK